MFHDPHRMPAAVNAELDHIFVMTSVDAPGAAALTQLGFKEGLPNTHPGQGSACRRFFFQTSYLELIWVHNGDEAQSEPAGRMGLWERWSGRLQGTCPFGIVLRPSIDAADTTPPFPTWSYRPAYLPQGLSIEVAEAVPLAEPAFFWLPFRRAGGQNPQTITNVQCLGPFNASSHAARFAGAAGMIEFKRHDEYSIELTLDGGVLNKRADLLPALPIRLQW